MGDPEASSNIERIRLRMAENDKFREEARNKIADVQESQRQADIAGTIAGNLAKGTDADVQKVVDDAPAAIEELLQALTDADDLVTSLQDTYDVIDSKMQTLNNKTNLTTQDYDNLAKFQTDLQKTSI